MAKNSLDDKEKVVVVGDVGQQFATSVVVPKVDGLVEASGVSISRVAVEQTLDAMMDQMVTDGLVSRDKMNQYKKPHHGGGRHNPAWLGIDVNDQSQFHKDMNEILGKGLSIEAPSVEAAKDKLLQVVSKVCNKVGLESVSKACQNEMVLNRPSQIGVGVRENAERIGEAMRQRQQNAAQDVRSDRVVDRVVVKGSGGRGF